MKKMKQLLVYSASACILILSACTNNNKVTSTTEVKILTKMTESTTEVTLQTALASIYNYGNFWRSQPNSGSYINKVTRAFLIPGTDLVNVLKPNPGANLLGQCEYNQARAYLGIDSTNTIHLYLTPVDANGNDVILTNDQGQQIVYDLTSPCPVTCEPTSVLYKAFDNGN
jgi:hypothetical protein